MVAADLSETFARLRTGDKEAFGQIYTELKQPVFTIVSRIVQARELAEDITQDLFLKLYTAPPDASVRNIRAWVFQMARNLAIDALRKTRSLALEDADTVSEDIFGPMLIRWDMETAISMLPRTQREILTLHIKAELPFNDIARIVGLSLPATYRKYRNAIQTLQQLLGGGAL